MIAVHEIPPSVFIDVPQERQDLVQDFDLNPVRLVFGFLPSLIHMPRLGCLRTGK
ncbi:MAG: hypothetical protein PHS56_03300 [Eubacteriales bacterium]|nr:hypothetical protein [Eubacteriales bacterium]MDD4078995.1 hypothetical protein [Eubacteriales bacterium]